MNTLDKQIYDLREDKKVLLSLERLLTNSDFKKVIMEDLYTDFKTMADSKYNSLYNLYNDSITSIKKVIFKPL